MIHKIVSQLVLVAVVSVAVTGCAPESKTAGTKRVYYHDRRTTVGSNIPKSYSDADGPVNAGGQSELEREQMQRMQGSAGSMSSGVGGGGGGGVGGGR